MGAATFDSRQATDVFDKSAILNQCRTVIIWRNLGGKRQREEQDEEGEEAAKAQLSVGMGGVIILIALVLRGIMFVGHVRVIFLTENRHAHRRDQKQNSR